MLNNFFNNILMPRSVSPLVGWQNSALRLKYPALIGLGTKSSKNKM